MLSEFELIARYFAPLARSFPGAYGLRDDAAVISPCTGSELVVKTDTIVSGIDFPADSAPEFIARKALRVNLSDLAAKGARPRAYLVDLVAAATLEESWVAGFAAGLEKDQDEFGIALIGGDTSSTSGPVVIALTVLGEAPIGRIIRRGGAQPGDFLFVTGTIGDAALGLAALQGELPGLEPSAAEFLLNRYRLPQPRVALGPELIGLATAGIDISDGLIADLRHLCEVSSLDAIVQSESLPLSSAARQAIARHPGYLATVFTGGDDYEVLFTAAESATSRIAQLSRTFRIPISRIGRMAMPLVAGEPRVAVLDPSGRPLTFASEGWRHFGPLRSRPAP